MKNSKLVRAVNIILALVLCFMFVVSIIDTNERRYDTAFSFEAMNEHIEKLCKNGPRSLFQAESNEFALDYLVSQVESYGIAKGDTTDAPAYMVQDYVASDIAAEYQNFYLKNLIVHIPANAEETTGEAIMFMGHYDSTPMGEGASDDGVACAVMLEAIRYYLNEMKNGYTLTNDLVFCFVNGEEFDLYGSRAFIEEFKGFDDVVSRIKFATNLESRGTSGTLIMFETAANNYKTVQLFAEVNKSAYTCSIATMVYDMMPNGTDFSSFKHLYQGLNMANIGGGENYHTQNDVPENVGEVYLSQQAQMVDAIIAKLASYDLDLLYDADESAIFFSYLNVATVIYDHTTTIILAIVVIALIAANVILSAVYRKQNNVAKTAKALLAIVACLLISAGFVYLLYFLFQYVAVLLGVIDSHMVGTITYSSIPIVIGIGLAVLSITIFTTLAATKWLGIARRDLTRSFAYVHGLLGVVLSFAVPDASYLFIFSAIMLLVNELVITLVKRTNMAKYHFALLATALYFPIVVPVVFLATSALGMTMAYVYGLVFALTLFDVGICITSFCEKFSLRALGKKGVRVSELEGAIHIMVVALIILLAVSIAKPNASVNLQGKQNIAKFPYDDALVYVKDADGDVEYRVYDLNAVGALSKYAPEMTYQGEYYVGEGEIKDIKYESKAKAKDNVLSVKKNFISSIVYLEFTNINAESFTIDDGKTTRTYTFGDADTYKVTIHSDCKVILNGEGADVAYVEALRDYKKLIPKGYGKDPEKLHFNLWLTAEYSLAK